MLNRGFSLVHMPHPCVTNFAMKHLGSRVPVEIFRWFKKHTVPLGQETPETIWAIGIWLDASNSRPEFSELVWGATDKIRRTGAL
jgi:2-oxoglutarate ferredoxin oxidoreductase subunit beta